MEKVVKREYLYRGRILNLRLDTVRLNDGKEAIREIIEHPGAAVIVPVDAEGNVLLVRQYRHAVGREMLEVPAGTLEQGEPPDQAAVRELKEETGCSAQRFDLLAAFYSSPGILTERMHVYLARDLTEGESKPESDEDLHLSKIPLRQALGMVGRGEIQDAKSIIGLLLAWQKLNRMTSP